MHSDKLAYTLDDLDLKFRAMTARPGTSRIPLSNEQMELARERRREILLGKQPPYTPGMPQPDALPNEAIAEPSVNGADARADRIIRHGKSQLRRLDQLRDLFLTYHKMTRSEITRILGVSPNTATKDLKALCDEGFVERIEPTASTRSHYFVLKRRPNSV
jgi:hypothetical protein